MRRTLLYIMVWLASVATAWAQKPLKRPLEFVRGENVMVIDQSADNFVLRALSVEPFLAPETPVLDKKTARSYRRLYRRGAMPQSTDSLARLLLVSGDARYAHALDSLKREASRGLTIDSLRSPAARTLLNSLSWTAATDDHGAYINLFEDCIITVATDKFRFSIDQIREGDHYKYRISGLKGSQVLKLRLRLPEGRMPTYFLNGRRLLRPVFERGYLVIEREWRNGDEVFYRPA